mgnify:CR=1 FL=1
MTSIKPEPVNNLDVVNDKRYEGIYGSYLITSQDKIEVRFYRLSVLFCGISYAACTFCLLLLKPLIASIFLILMAISLGLSLKWIHIYLRPLHQFLQVLWLLGCIGITILFVNFGLNNVFSELAEKSQNTLLIGPLFASLTGLGFKEFFCFRRVEAIGLTLLLPAALLGHLINLLKPEHVISMLIMSSFLLIILAVRKFGMEEAADIGDKSVFEYLAQTKNL